MHGFVHGIGLAPVVFAGERFPEPAQPGAGAVTAKPRFGIALDREVHDAQE